VLEGQLYLADEFIKAKVSLLEDKISGKFGGVVRFKMFNQLINGGIEPCCETLVNTNGAWVPYSDTNNAGQINAGLSIINVLSEHYQFSAPIFVDNAEAVTELAGTNAQVISLVVSKQDKKLRVVCESSKAKGAA